MNEQQKETLKQYIGEGIGKLLVGIWKSYELRSKIAVRYDDDTGRAFRLTFEEITEKKDEK